MERSSHVTERVARSKGESCGIERSKRSLGKLKSQASCKSSAVQRSSRELAQWIDLSSELATPSRTQANAAASAAHVARACDGTAELGGW